MMVLKEHLNDDVLAIASGQVDVSSWNFNLQFHIAEINKNFPDLNLFIVGYRDEERPAFDDQGRQSSGERTNVPYFVVHARPQSAEYPRWLLLNDLEKKTTLLLAIIRNCLSVCLQIRPNHTS